MNHIEAVFFDLDGTLADTAPDLAYALNQTLLHYGETELSFEKIRPVVSHGGVALIKLGFDITPEAKEFKEIRQFLLNVYLQNIARHTQLFPGMALVLDTLEKNNILWGVVTNKPGWLTEPLMLALNLTDRASSIVSGDTLDKNKPDPAPILLACEQSNVNPENCLYVGDAERDIIAGRRAGMKTVAALFGYLLEDDIPAQWQATYSINHSSELLDIL